MSGKKEKPARKSFQLKLASKAYNAKYKKTNPGPAYAWPMGAWFSLFFIIPLFIIVRYSFLKRNVYGGVTDEFSLKAYEQMFSPAYGMIFLRTLWLTVIPTAITILISLPCGYAMARSKRQTLLLILVVVPFLTNSLIRIFAWMTILGDNGFLNQILSLLHRIICALTGSAKEFAPHKFMYTRGAVILVSIYMYLPYAILPIFTAVDRFDFTLLEAARDLGATKAQSMFKVLIPGIKSGILSAMIFTFIPIFGTYTVPQLVGGKDSYMVGNIIFDQVKVRNWPLASAFSLVITIVSMAGVLLMLATGKKEAESNKKSEKEDTTPSIAESISKATLGGVK
ncbi:ABC transporter permease [Treponema sp.]|uniref:ABC transporter permease n=1 Tax=Treponema sp. TaxID=166 RepID=UPI003F055FD4